jgi:hypothetical protein
LSYLVFYTCDVNSSDDLYQNKCIDDIEEQFSKVQYEEKKVALELMKDFRH